MRRAGILFQRRQAARLAGEEGKLTPAVIEEAVTRRSDIHYPKPKVVTLTQASEVGTVYQPDELRAITDDGARELGLRVHMDGARFANAVASLGVSAGRVTWRAGVDVLCFGGTKMGCRLAKRWFFRPPPGRRLCLSLQTGRPAGVEDALPVRTVAGNSRKRQLVAPRRARQRHGPAVGGGLAEGIAVADAFSGRRQRRFRAPAERIEQGLRARGWLFYTFIGAGGARLMCGWDTAPETVDRFLDDLRDLVGATGIVTPGWQFCPLCRAPRRCAGSDLPRLACGAGCGFVHWDNPAPVLAALVEYQGRVVLARNRAWAAGAFGLITGFLERGEDPAPVSRVRSRKNWASTRRRRR
jgi:hypothetical protein